MKTRGLAPFWLDPNDPDADFPEVSLALTEPDGLLAIGGDLSPNRLLRAYPAGIFPWYNPDQPILWWSPNPRAVLFPEKLKVSRSLQKSMRNRGYRVSMNENFSAVIEACSEPRRHESGTWITAEMKRAFIQLHHLGWAHSVECWSDQKLVGGLYGLAIDRVFYGESMFCRATDASKVAFVELVKLIQEQGFNLVDCQVSSKHLFSLGAELIPRNRFVEIIKSKAPF